MSNLSMMFAHGPAGRRPRMRIDPVVIAAAALLAAIFAAELLIGVRAAPAVDLLAPADVT